MINNYKFVLAKPIKEIINSYLDNKKYKNINNLLIIDKTWKSIVGKTIAQNTKIKSYKNETLIIETKNSVWRNEISLQKNLIEKKLKLKLKQIKINKIILK